MSEREMAEPIPPSAQGPQGARTLGTLVGEPFRRVQVVDRVYGEEEAKVMGLAQGQ